MKLTEQQFNRDVAGVTDNIMKAVKDYQHNPEKAERYIRRKIKDMAKAGQLYSELSITNQLFG